MFKRFQSKYRFILISYFLCVFAAQAQTFTVANIEHLKNPIDIYVRTYIPNGERPTMGSCWGTTGDLIKKYENLSYDVTEKLLADEHSYICLEARLGSQKFATNPLINTPECKIQFYVVQGGGDNPGFARATPECGYMGRCADGIAYNYNGRHYKGEDGKGSDAFKKNCLPYKIFP